MEINGHITDEKTLIKGTCPFHFGLEDESDCTSTGGEGCIKCWNREMPDTEPKDELKERLELIDELKKVEYNKGLDDAWEFMKKWHDMTASQCMDVFETSSSRVMLSRFAPQEAIAKLKEYEETQSKIEVGDVVQGIDYKAVVLDISNDKIFYILTETGCVEQALIKGFKKTGRKVDVKSFLEQIGE